MRVCVIGLGYIGFPTACLMASAGHQVVGVDTRESLIERLRNGQVHIAEEPGLAELAVSVLKNGTLQVSAKPVEADAFIICVPTPLTRTQEVQNSPDSLQNTETGVALTEVAAASAFENHGTTNAPATLPSADLSYVQSAVESIAPVLRRGNLVVVESTVPPGTTENLVLPILERHGWTREDILLAHAPERVLPGAILRELVENDRVVGGLTSEATEAAKELYATFVKGEIFTTDAKTAEFVKLIENTYRDVNIALANEFARVAEYLGIDVQEAITVANRHPRVNILNPGPGVGGHCLPIDPYFIVQCAPHLTPLIQTARAINNGMVDHIVNMVAELSKEHGLQRWVMLGAAYKTNVSDERESPALRIAERLQQLGLSVVIHDPFIERFANPLEELVAGADALLLTTDHSAYLSLDPARIGEKMARRFLVDTRLRLDAEAWRSNGFVVRRLGDGRTLHWVMRN